MSKVLDPSKDARKRAKEAQRQQEQELAKQRQVEEARLAEEESEIARRKALGERVLVVDPCLSQPLRRAQLTLGVLLPWVVNNG